ncbi:MAG: hypothetical protein K9K88_16720 [Desulfobacterales bacterium]|nr:hypothetical protein [Desulfobacterales bacterium]
METEIKLKVKPEDIIEAVKAMSKQDREDFLEDLLASTSPEYLQSIREARSEYESGDVKKHNELFDK